MTEEQIKRYYETREQLLNDEIELEEWRRFCDRFLDDIMEEHKEVFKRLKSR